jgi:excisionase family DNA binding protein
VNIKDDPEYQALKNDIQQQTEASNKKLFDLLAGLSEENTLSVKEVAEIFNVHEVSVRRWIKFGELKAVRFSGYRINPIDIVKFVRGRTIEVARQQEIETNE